MVAAASPPRYNYFELGGGKNCARWVLDVTAAAGIEARHWLASIIAVPKWLVRPHEPIGDEWQMWQRRRAGIAHGRSVPMRERRNRRGSRQAEA